MMNPMGAKNSVRNRPLSYASRLAHGEVGRVVFASSVLLAVGWALLWPQPCVAWKQTLSSKGVPVSWPDPCVEVYINDQGSDDVGGDGEFDALRSSMATWTSVDCASASLTPLGLTNMSTTGYFDEHPVANLVVFREHHWPYTQRPVAFTSVTYNPKTGEIFDADIELNGEDFLFTVSPVSEPYKIDIESTVTHELGHVVGLDHSNEPFATMYFRTQPGDTSMRSLEADDVEGICSIYPGPSETECRKVEESYFHVEPYVPSDGDSGGTCSVTTSRHPVAPLESLITLLFAAGALAALRFWRRIRGAIQCSCLRRTAAMVAFALVTLGAIDGHAFERYQSSQGALLQRNLEYPCVYRYWIDMRDLDDLDTDSEVIITQAAMAAWSSVGCTAFTWEFSGFLPDAKAAPKDGKDVIAWVFDNWTKDETYAALTTLTYNKFTGEISDSDIEINADLFEFTNCDSTTVQKVDFEFTILHECGHLYGFDHSKDPQAVMFSHSPFCSDSPGHALTADDEEAMCTVYGTAAVVDGCNAEPVTPEQSESEPDVVAADAGDTQSPPNPDPDHPETTCCCSLASPNVVAVPWPPVLCLMLLIAASVTVLRASRSSDPGRLTRQRGHQK